MKRLPACGVVQEEEEERKMVLVDRRKKRLSFASNSTLSTTKLSTWMVLTKLLFALRERWIACLWKEEAFASSASSAAACECWLVGACAKDGGAKEARGI
jgi:hypothetical protein